MAIYIIGSGGQGRVVADILRAAGADETTHINDADLLERYKKGDLVIVGVGDNFARSRIVHALTDKIPNIEFATAVHPHAVLAGDVSIGAGSVIMPGAIVNTGATIGDHVILNTNSSVDHDCVVGDYASLAPRATLGGTVKVGSHTAVGIGATVSHAVEIGEHTVIGAGAVVVKPMPSYSVCYGVPARVIRSRAPGDEYL